MKEFIIDGHRIQQFDDNGYWVFDRKGARSRFYDNNSAVAMRIRKGISLDVIDKTKRTFAEGTHEPVKAWRNPDGTIGIPADPSFSAPADSEPFEIRTLAEADRVGREIELETKLKWEGDHEFTAQMDDVLGNPRKQLISAMATARPFEKEVIRLALEDLDKEERDRQKINYHSSFHWRDYERGN